MDCYCCIGEKVLDPSKVVKAAVTQHRGTLLCEQHAMQMHVSEAAWDEAKLAAIGAAKYGP